MRATITDWLGIKATGIIMTKYAYYVVTDCVDPLPVSFRFVSFRFVSFRSCSHSGFYNLPPSCGITARAREVIPWLVVTTVYTLYRQQAVPLIFTVTIVQNSIIAEIACYFFK